MKRSKRLASFIGLVCGAELVVAAVIGGAGISTFFGKEGIFLAGILLFLLVAYLFSRYRSKTQLLSEKTRHLNQAEH